MSERAKPQPRVLLPPRRLGLIADTHGLLRDSALQALAGCELILHAGDIGSEVLLDALRRLAPVIAVRGNNDDGDWASAYAEHETLALAGLRLHLLHDLKTLDFDPVTAGVRIVVSGHSHRPKIETRDGVLYVNPGSAGPRRFSLPVSLARLSLVGPAPQAELITLR